MRKQIFKFYQTLIESFKDVTAHLYNCNLNILAVAGNYAFKKQGIDPDSLINKNIFEAYEDDHAKLIAPFWELALKGVENDFVSIGQGGHIWENSFYPLRDESGKIVLGIQTAKDVTAIKRQKIKLEEQNSRLIEISFQNSHKTRAPLARILGIVEAIKHQETLKNNDELIGHLFLSAQELDQVIREINQLTETQINPLSL